MEHSFKVTLNPPAAVQSIASVGPIGLSGDLETVRCLAPFPDIFVFGCDCTPVLRPSAGARLFAFDLMSSTDGLSLALKPLPRWAELVGALARLVQRDVEIVEGWPVIAAACAPDPNGPSSGIFVEISSEAPSC